MNARDAFDLIKEFNSMQQQIIDTEASRRKQMREELMDMLGDREPEPSEPMEDELLKGFAQMWMQKQQAAASPTPPVAPVPSAPAAEASPVFTNEHAEAIALDLKARLPKQICKQIIDGSIDEGMALQYLSAWNIPDHNARMIYEAMRSSK